MVHVPYKDQSQMYVGIANGDLDWAFTTLGSALPLMQAGRIKLIAVAAPRRSRAPPGVVRKINGDVNRVLADPDVVAQLATFGFDGAAESPEQLAEEIRADAK